MAPASATLGLLATTLIFLISGGSALTEDSNENLKAYTLYPGIGYLQGIMGTGYNWTLAFEHCVTLGGLLAVPNSAAEVEVYKEIIAAGFPEYQQVVFVGFHDLFVNGDYETVLDYPLERSGFVEWNRGYPNTAPYLRCGRFLKEGLLEAFNCGVIVNSMFICERPLWADYDLVPGVGYYKLHVTAKTWPEAWQTCRGEGSHLAVINNQAEYQALQEIFARHPTIPTADYENYAWVGVHASYVTDVFRTVLSTSLEKAGYSTWASGEPSSIQEDIYGLLERNNGNLRARGNIKIAFFCEHEL